MNGRGRTCRTLLALLALLLCATMARAAGLPQSLPPVSQQDLPPEVRQALTAGAPVALPGIAGPQVVQPDLPADAARLGRPGEALDLPPPRPLGQSLRPPPSEPPPAAIQPGGPATPSPTERLYRQRYGSELATDLRQYGYDLFGNVSTGPRQELPGPGYRLGPGDMLTVRFSGTGLDRRLSAGVDADGRLDLPGMGQVAVAGLGLAEAEAAVRQLAQRYVAGVDIRLGLESLRQMQVYVVGEVGRPGLLSVPALSTALSALAQAGGVNKTGSLRRLRLFCEGQPPKDLDLYALLLAGDRRADAPLQDRDVLFVPRLGPTAAVAGAVRHPAIYELKGEAGVAELLRPKDQDMFR